LDRVLLPVWDMESELVWDTL
jgi:hypothetical protein